MVFGAGPIGLMMAMVFGAAAGPLVAQSRAAPPPLRVSGTGCDWLYHSSTLCYNIWWCMQGKHPWAERSGRGWEANKGLRQCLNG